MPQTQFCCQILLWIRPCSALTWLYISIKFLFWHFHILATRLTKKKRRNVKDEAERNWRRIDINIHQRRNSDERSTRHKDEAIRSEWKSWWNWPTLAEMEKELTTRFGYFRIEGVEDQIDVINTPFSGLPFIKQQSMFIRVNRIFNSAFQISITQT